jgi:uncharacterized RDD family membrane protein YckC
MFFSGWVLGELEENGEEASGLTRAILFISIWGVYEPVSMAMGSTVGNYLMKIRVRRFNNTEKRINIFQAYGRFIIKFLLGWLSFLTMGLNKEKRAIHDLMTGTIVIEK